MQSLLALWLFERFELSLATGGPIFFWTGVLSAFSYLVAVRIAERIGLVNTMVFTHLPSNSADRWCRSCRTSRWVVALLLVRSALSQMDVPTRSSYVMAVVSPAERAAAASITVGAAQPRVRGEPAHRRLPARLVDVRLAAGLAGALKIAYDLRCSPCSARFVRRRRRAASNRSRSPIR